MSVIYLPLTPQQEELWEVWKLYPSSIANNIQSVYVLNGKLNPQRFLKSFESAAFEFEVFRTRFFEDKYGSPRRYIEDSFRESPCCYVDLWSENKCEQPQVLHKKAESIFQEKINKGFDLESDVLVCFMLIRYEEKKFFFFFSAPHIVVDGHGCFVLFASSCMRYAIGGWLSNLLFKKYKKASTYINYLEAISSEERERSNQYWLGKLKEKKLAMDFQRVDGGFELGDHVSSLQGATCNAVKLFCKNEKISTFSFLSAAYGSFLSRYFNKDEIWAFYPKNIRPKEQKYLVDFCVTMLPLKVDCTAPMSFLELLRVTKLQRKEDDSVLPITLTEALRLAGQEIGVKYLNAISRTYAGNNFLTLRRLFLYNSVKASSHKFHSGGSDCCLGFMYDSSQRELLIKFEYNKVLFSPDFIDEFSKKFKTYLSRLVESPRQELSKIEILAPEEKKKILYAVFVNVVVVFFGFLMPPFSSYPALVQD